MRPDAESGTVVDQNAPAGEPLIWPFNLHRSLAPV